MTNQWHFYVITNSAGFTNAAFVTFLAPDLSLPRIGADAFTLDNATRPEADIDLYVSTDPGLLALDPNVVSNCVNQIGNNGVIAYNASLGPLGTELVAYSNAAPDQVYYIGVKSEDQMAAQYDFLGAFSLLPFSSQDQNGFTIVQGIPLPADIPDGTPRVPGGVTVLGLNISDFQVRALS